MLACFDQSELSAEWWQPHHPAIRINPVKNARHVRTAYPKTGGSGREWNGTYRSDPQNVSGREYKSATSHSWTQSAGKSTVGNRAIHRGVAELPDCRSRGQGGGRRERDGLALAQRPGVC
jgi:hypothetical protein